MATLTRHPLFIAADKVKRAFLVNKFHLFDDNELPEIIRSEQNHPLFQLPEQEIPKPVSLDDKKYMLRTSLLLPAVLNMKKGSCLKEFLCGTVYDRRTPPRIDHYVIEGICSGADIIERKYIRLWHQILSEILGLESKPQLCRLTDGLYEISIQHSDNTKRIVGYTGAGNWLARSFLTPASDEQLWVFTLNVEAIAMELFHLKDRATLYSNQVRELKQYAWDMPACGNPLQSRISDTLRKMGYLEYISEKVYEADAYVKMNMFQGAWDRNNKGIPLTDPLDSYTALPTVMTPALEKVLGDNSKQGESAVRIFGFCHSFLPAAPETPLSEKLLLTIGAYGDGMDIKQFKKDMDQFLTELGIQNHYFIPTDIPIPYQEGECYLLMDDGPSYLNGNFGGICEIAQTNYGISKHAFMANLELSPLGNNIERELHFTAPEKA